MNKIDFAIAVLNLNSEIFVVYKVIWRNKKIAMHFVKKAQLKIEIILLDKVFIVFLTKHFNYSNIFLVKNIIKLSKYTKINNHSKGLKKN